MKTIKTVDGEIINGYEFLDLSNDARDRVIKDHINFEIDIMDELSPYYYLAMEMERMQTPWFLGECIYEKHLDDLIGDIEINKYLFDKHGKILPMLYYNKKNVVVRITYDNIECTLK